MTNDELLNELRKYSIFVGTPMYGGECHGLYARALSDLTSMCTANGIKLQSYFLFNESLVQRARNYVTDEFLRSDATHLLFIDSDISFNPNDVLSLLALQITNKTKYDVLCGPYPKKTIAWEKVQKAAELGKGKENPAQLQEYAADFVFNTVPGVTEFYLNKPVEVSESGTGFMLIPRELLIKYREAYPDLSYKPDHVRTEAFDGSREITAFFDCIIDPESKRYLSEDYFFCHNVRKMGSKVHICPWVQLRHCGNYIFNGSLQALAELELSFTADETSKLK
jgi:hypothetical protein